MLSRCFVNDVLFYGHKSNSFVIAHKNKKTPETVDM